jgi:murein DD-endopeptidase MepM/ murein hydrolase activator NlpD
MQARVSWSAFGRCALLSTSLSALTLVGGCSSGVSRFDFPSFGLTRSEQTAPLADPNTTASLPPVPPESVYAQGAPSYSQGGPNYGQGAPSYSQSAQSYGQGAPNAYQGGSYSRSTLPPVPQSYSQATPAAYSPPSASLKPDRAAYAPPPPPAPPPSHLAKVRAAAEPAAKGEIYKVQAGDTPRSIAQKTGVSERALIDRNNLDPVRLRIGQTLSLPKGGKAPIAPRAVAAKESKPASAPDIHVVKTTAIEPPAPAAKRQSAPKPQAAPAVASDDEVIGGQNPQVASTQQLPAPEPMSGNSFRWPVQGRIISEFGTKPDGGHNDGINVAVPLGTSVKAAENGVVAYAGDELKGYGNLVLIRHSNNWVSAYAHNDEILVKRGDQVRRGQVIAKAGRTGQVNQPQLHFELRKGSRPVDPTKYMTNSTANAD